MNLEITGDVKRGARIADSPITGKKYLVTKWVDKGGGKLVALEKQEIEEQDQTET